MTVQSSGYCGEPPPVPHARHNAPLEQNSFTLDTELQYQCYPGYNTIGFARARCLAYNSTVKWFGPDVTCERKFLLFPSIRPDRTLGQSRWTPLEDEAELILPQQSLGGERRGPQ